MAGSNASLGLYPEQSDKLDIANLLACCEELQLLGAAIDEKFGVYLAGERFLEHINYLGCSPNIEFEPNKNEFYTHIRLHQLDSPVLFHGRYSRPPLCRHCDKLNKSWVKSDITPVMDHACEHCGHRASLADYDWRRTAAVTRVMIEITEVFPKEAVPQPSLMQALESATGTAWSHCYF